MNVVTVYERFEDLPEWCGEMFDKAPIADGADIFFSLPWFRHFADTALENTHRLRIYGIGATMQPMLLMPMCRHVSANRFPGLRRLTALVNYYTPLFGPIVAPSGTVVEPALNTLVQFMAQERPRWDAIDLHPLDADGLVLNYLDAAFQAAGMPTQRYFCFGNWFLEVNGRSYQAYFDDLPSRLRHTLTRKSRHLETSNRLRIDIVLNGPELEGAIAVYEAIYGSSWKEKEPSPSFIPGLIRLCAERGCLRLGIAYVDNIPAAAQIWIVHNRVASIYKLAYVEQFSRFSIGSILTGSLMRHVIDVDRVREVDFLSGDDAYKKDWMSGRRERWGIIAFNLRTLRGSIAALGHIGGHRIKGFFRGSRQHQPAIGAH